MSERVEHCAIPMDVDEQPQLDSSLNESLQADILSRVASFSAHLVTWLDCHMEPSPMQLVQRRLLHFGPGLERF